MEGGISTFYFKMMIFFTEEDISTSFYFSVCMIRISCHFFCVSFFAMIICRF